MENQIPKQKKRIIFIHIVNLGLLGFFALAAIKVSLLGSLVSIPFLLYLFVAFQKKIYFKKFLGFSWFLIILYLVIFYLLDALDLYLLDPSLEKAITFSSLLLPITALLTCFFLDISRHFRNHKEKNKKNIILKIFILLFSGILLSILFVTISPNKKVGYHKYLGSFYYGQGYDWKFGSYQKIKITKADKKTFQVIKDPYAKDKNFVYYKGRIIKRADPNRFIIFSDNNNYAKDKYLVYYQGEKIENSDVATFNVFEKNPSYATDKSFVYYKGKKIDGSDGKSLVEINDNYLKDKNLVYHQTGFLNIVSGAEPASFVALKNNYGKDNNNAYNRADLIVKNIDSETFEILGDGRHYAKDKNFVYSLSNCDHNCKLIESADPTSFMVIGNGYAKDKDFVYYYGKFISVDTESFEILEAGYTEDKDFIYYERSPIENGGDPQSFKVLDEYWPYAKDKNFVYYGEKIIRDADIKSFEVIERTTRAKDKNHVYEFGKIIEGADPETFKP